MALNKNNGIVVVENSITNTSVNIITITEDKLENILIKHVAKLKKKRDWFGALALSITLLATLLTADFNQKIGIPPVAVKTIFWILFIASLIYLVYTIYNACANNDNVKNIIKDIKNEL